MRDETKQGQEWIGESIKQSSSVELDIEWAQDDDRGPPDASGLSKIKSFYRVAVITPEGNRYTERIRTEDIDDCAHNDNVEVRRRVGQQMLDWLVHLGIAK